MRIRKAILFWTLFLTSCFLLQYDLMATRSPLGVFKNFDEAWYGIVMSRTQSQGCEAGIPVTFLFPERKSFHTCGFFKFLNSVSPFADPIRRTVFLKIGARIITLGLFCILSFLILKSAFAGILLGTWYFLDPGLEGFKPAIILLARLVTSNYILFTQANRFISPLHYLIPGLLCAVSCIALIRIDRKPTARGVTSQSFYPVWATLLTLGILLESLTPFYSWIPIFYILGCILLYSFYFNTPRTTGLIGTILFCGALAAAYQSLAKSSFLFKDEVLRRSGFFMHNFSPVFPFHKGLIFASISLGVSSYFVFKRRWVPAVLVGGGLYVLQNINMITGYELQNFHFKDYLSPFFLSALFFVTLTYVPDRVRTKVYLGFSGIVICGFMYFVGSQSHVMAEIGPIPNRDDDMIVATAKKLFKDKKVFCHNWTTNLPILAQTVCYENNTLFTYPISNLELLEIYYTNFRLLGYSKSDVNSYFKKTIVNDSIATWEFGLKAEWVESIPLNQGFTRVLKEKFLPKWIQGYSQFSDQDLKKSIQGIDYFILKRNHSLISAGWFQPVQEFTEYGIYQLIPTSSLPY